MIPSKPITQPPVTGDSPALGASMLPLAGVNASDGLDGLFQRTLSAPDSAVSPTKAAKPKTKAHHTQEQNEQALLDNLADKRLERRRGLVEKDLGPDTETRKVSPRRARPEHEDFSSNDIGADRYPQEEQLRAAPIDRTSSRSPTEADHNIVATRLRTEPQRGMPTGQYYAKPSGLDNPNARVFMATEPATDPRVLQSYIEPTQDTAGRVYSENPTLAFLTGNLEYIEPKAIPSVVTQSPFISQALEGVDIESFMKTPIPMHQLMDALGASAQVVEAVVNMGINLAEAVTPNAIFKALGLDPSQVSAELTRLRENLRFGGLTKYMTRAAVLAKQKPVNNEAGMAGPPSPGRSQVIYGEQRPVQVKQRLTERPHQVMPLGPAEAGVQNGRPLPIAQGGGAPVVQGMTATGLPGEPAPLGPNLVQLTEDHMLATLGPQDYPTNTGAEGRLDLSGVAERLETRLEHSGQSQFAPATVSNKDPFETMGLQMNDKTVTRIDLSQNIEPTVAPAEQMKLGRESSDIQPADILSAEALPVSEAPKTAATTELQQKTPIARDANEKSPQTLPEEGFAQKSPYGQSLTTPQNPQNPQNVSANQNLAGSQANGIKQPSFDLERMEAATRIKDVSNQPGKSTDMATTGPSGRQFNFDFSRHQPANQVAAPSKTESLFEIATKESAKVALSPKIIEKSQMLLRDGGGAMKINLGATELGHLDLALDVAEDTVKLRIIANNEDVRDILVNDLPKLREALYDQNINLTNVEVDVRGKSSWTENFGHGTEQGFRQSFSQDEHHHQSFERFPGALGANVAKRASRIAHQSVIPSHSGSIRILV